MNRQALLLLLLLRTVSLYMKISRDKRHIGRETRTEAETERRDRALLFLFLC